METETPEVRAAHERCLRAIAALNRAYAHPGDNSEEANHARREALDEYHAAGRALVDAWTASTATSRQVVYEAERVILA
jgi:predicted secreted protein